MKWWAATFLGLALIACGDGRESEGASTEVMLSEGLDFNPAEIAAFRVQADQGDVEAANTLAVFYANEFNIPESMRWLGVAATHGDCNALQVLRQDQRATQTTVMSDAEMARLSREFGCPLN